MNKTSKERFFASLFNGASWTAGVEIAQTVLNESLEKHLYGLLTLVGVTLIAWGAREFGDRILFSPQTYRRSRRNRNL